MKKSIFKCMALVLAMIAASVNVSAQLVWDGTSSPWTHGTGTANDPYLIETPQNLSMLSDMVNNGMTYNGVYFKQTADFNMNGNSYKFNVIGNTASNCFSGHYDGNFNSISNLSVSNSSDCLGLFGYTSNAVLHGICMKGIRGSGIDGTNKYYVGSISANSTRDTITECSCKGDVTLSENLSSSLSSIGCTCIGGLVGKSAGSYIANCGVNGDINCTRSYCIYYDAGGLVGYISYHNSVTYYTTLQSCYFVGDINISGSFAWGKSYRTYYGLMIGYTQGAYLNNSYGVGGFNCISDAYVSSADAIAGYSDAVDYLTAYNVSYSGSGLPSSSSYATNRADSYVKSLAFPIVMNTGLDSTVFYYDSLNVNDGYPIFWYQKPVKYRVNTTCDATMGSVSGMGSYANGTTATLQAEAAEGYLFTGWSDGNIENPRTVTVTSDSTYTAVFTKNAYTIHVKQDCSVSVQ